jgi:ABC-2 type transport system ATP-binding protein
MIALCDVTKTFGGVPALNRINLEVPQGEIFGLVGPDGAGKTSLIRLITGISTPTSGSVTVLGQTRLEKIKPELGYVPQKFSLYGDMTVMENIRFIGSLYGASAQTIRAKAEEILTFTKLFEFKDRLAANLSGGMKQKLALAAGLMHKPRLFCLDEPTTGVDPVSRREFWQMLYTLNKEGMTVFVSTPYMDEAELCTVVALINRGQIVACAPPRQLKADYPYKVLELSVAAEDIRQHLQDCPGVIDINAFGAKYHLAVDDPSHTSERIKEILTASRIIIHSLKEIAPSMEDVFVALGENRHKA